MTYNACVYTPYCHLKDQAQHFDSASNDYREFVVGCKKADDAQSSQSAQPALVTA